MTESDRGNTPGDLIGPYISQFLWKDVPYGATTIVQRYRTILPGNDHMTRYPDWLASQNGASTGSNQFDPTPRYIRNGRDLSEYVHQDLTYQAFLNACLILLEMGAAVDARNPYRDSLTQCSFITFGSVHILHLVTAVAICALKAAWYQKWLMHRRLRPEAFGARIHNHMTRASKYPVHSDILNSLALDEAFSTNATNLLPQAFSEGSPTHHAYPSGHATVLKAFFDESFVIPNPVAASADGLSLLPYREANLTVGGVNSTNSHPTSPLEETRQGFIGARTATEDYTWAKKLPSASSGRRNQPLIRILAASVSPSLTT